MDLFLRATPANPTRPAPKNNIVLGYGTGPTSWVAPLQCRLVPRQYLYELRYNQKSILMIKTESFNTNAEAKYQLFENVCRLG